MAARPRIPVLGNAVEVAPTVLKKPAGPILWRAFKGPEVLQVLSAQFASEIHCVQHIARREQCHRRIHLAHGFRKFIVLKNVVLQIGAAELPSSIRLVAYVPELNVIRLRMTISRPHRPQACAYRAVHVFDFFSGGVRISEACVPCVVEHGWTCVRVADRIVPSPIRKKVASRQAPEAGVQLPQKRRRVWTKSAYIVGGHQRNRANVKVPCARGCDCESDLVDTGTRCETKQKLFVRIRRRCDGNSLTIALAVSPHQTDLYLCAGCASKIDSACISLALH